MLYNKKENLETVAKFLSWFEEHKSFVQEAEKHGFPISQMKDFIYSEIDSDNFKKSSPSSIIQFGESRATSQSGGELNMKKLNVTIQCMAVYNSAIEVPNEMSLEDALEYAEAHLDDIPLGVLEYVRDSDQLDRENCDFDEIDRPGFLAPTVDSFSKKNELLKYENGKAYLDNVEIFLDESNFPCVQFPGEEEPRILRDKISDILAGDAFIVGEAILVADDNAYMLTGDWRVDDVDGAGGWREGDIDCDTVVAAEKYLRLVNGMDQPKNALSTLIESAATRAAGQQLSKNTPPKVPER